MNSVFKLALWKVLEILPSALEHLPLSHSIASQKWKPQHYFAGRALTGYNLSLNPGRKISSFSAIPSSFSSTSLPVLPDCIFQCSHSSF